MSHPVGIRVHQRQSREQLKKQKELWIKSVERYYGKLALLQEWEELGVEDEYVRGLRDTVRKTRIMLENKGALP